MLRLRNSHPKINIAGELRLNEPMAGHTTFGVGGPADIFARPQNPDDIRELLRFADAESVDWFVLGGGANILVADAGIRGIVMDMSSFDAIDTTVSEDGSTILEAGAGLPISDASAWAADHGLGGLQFIYSMPGSVAGAVWMNARCYDAEICDVLAHVDLIGRKGERARYLPDAKEFSYKRSPFQKPDTIMTSVGFRLRRSEPEALWAEMKQHENDRRAKGHFDAPCAGSVFKNNRAFGKPSGAILDSLGMRGRTAGGAKVSNLHANIIVNAGSATAEDIRVLSDQMATEAKEKLGIELEREILLVGEWNGSPPGIGERG